MIPDAVASALFELVQGGNKKQLLEELRIDYEKWCMESGFTITHLVIFVTFCISTGLQGFFTNISNRSQKLVFFNYRGFSLGVPHAARASRKLFTLDVITPSTTAYAHISQKILKGAAARMIVFWMALILEKIASQPGASVPDKLLGF